MEKKKKKAVIIMIACVLIVLIAIIAGLVFLLFKKDELDNATDDAKTYVIDEENYQQIMEDMENEVREGYFETYMNTEWTFPDGTSETTDAILGNSPNNTKPIRCEVLLEDTEEVSRVLGGLPARHRREGRRAAD